MQVTYSILLVTKGGRVLVRQVTLSTHDIVFIANTAKDEAHWNNAEVVAINVVAREGD